MYHDYTSPIIRFGSNLPDLEVRMKVLQSLFDQKNYLKLCSIHGRDPSVGKGIIGSRRIVDKLRLIGTDPYSAMWGTFLAEYKLK